MDNKDTDASCMTASTTPRDPTVGEHLDEKIQECRKRLEELCIVKAKAETMQVLKFPMSFIQSLMVWF